MVDLAGAERPGKNGAERISGWECAIAIANGRTDLEMPCQAVLINWELFEFCKEVNVCLDRTAKKMKYNPPM